jgi:flagellar hook-associated protein 3 FlgL
VSAPSDDPVAYVAIARGTTTLAHLDMRSRVVGRAKGDLDLAESSLASASDVMARVSELAVQMASGDMSPADRLGAANEVTQLRQTLVGLANTRGESGYLFGGTATGAPPFSGAGAFVGNDGVQQVEVATGVLAAANVSGAKAFTAVGGSNVLADLQALATALSTNDVATVQASVSTIDADHGQIVRARADAGVSAGRLGSAIEVTSTARLAVEAAKGNEADIDAPSVYSDLTAAESAYQRSLDVTRQMLALTSINR